jgi:flagellar biosynthesis/type III secretory pathway M-ring protein FliF/YscJ
MGQEAIEYHEKDLRAVLERLHRPLRDQVEKSRRLPRWNELDRNEKIGIISLGLAVVGIAVAFILA